MHGLNVAPHVEKDFKEEEEQFDKDKVMEADLVEEVTHNQEIVIMVLVRVSNFKYIFNIEFMIDTKNQYFLKTTKWQSVIML